MTKMDCATIYLVRCEEYIKVGVSRTPAQRIASFKTSNPYPVSLVEKYYIDDWFVALLLERECHLRLVESGIKKSGEWFLADDVFVIGITNSVYSLYKEYGCDYIIERQEKVKAIRRLRDGAIRTLTTNILMESFNFAEIEVSKIYAENSLRSVMNGFDFDIYMKAVEEANKIIAEKRKKRIEDQEEKKLIAAKIKKIRAAEKAKKLRAEKRKKK